MCIRDRAKKDNNIEKSYEFVIFEGDKKFKRMYQAASPEERKKFGYDVPNDADDADLEITRLKNEWSVSYTHLESV